MPATAEVSLPSDTEIRVVRDFAAPRSLVYLAFTKAELVKRWLLGPPGWTMPVCEIDLRVGGKYRYRWRSDKDGAEFGFVGAYSRIEPEQRIGMSEWPDMPDPPGMMQVETSFSDEGDGTRVEYRMVCDSKASRDAAIGTGMTDGMEQSFKSLDRVLGETGGT